MFTIYYSKRRSMSKAQKDSLTITRVFQGTPKNWKFFIKEFIMNKTTSEIDDITYNQRTNKAKALLSSMDNSNLELAQHLFEARENTKCGWKHEDGTIKYFKDYCNSLGINEKIVMKILKEYNSIDNTFYDIDKVRNLFLDLASL